MAGYNAKGDVAVMNKDLALRCSTRITLGASATLATILAAGAPAVILALGDLMLRIVPESSADDIRFTDDAATAASAATPKFPAAGEDVPASLTYLNAMRFYFNGTAYATVHVFTARN
jgi:hypothetical protein